MFKISEFSHLVRISPQMLRHYEKCGLLYPAEIDKFTGYRANGYAIDISDTRYHHEIYLSDPRKTGPAKLKTVIRHPVR